LFPGVIIDAEEYAMPPSHDLTDRRFGSLTAVRGVEAEPHLKTRRARWECRCDCGNVVRAFANNLLRGKHQGCGLHKGGNIAKTKTRHGKTGTQVYRAWRNMLNRCYNLRVKSYADYGAKGVTVCQAWRDSFDAFYRDMGEPPTSRHTIERLENARGYEPGNCAWATRKQQNRNQTKTRHVTFRGETRPLPEWAEILGVPRVSLWQRLFKYGWDVERAFTAPARPRSYKQTGI
jgi:hypothetical protein